MQWKFYHDKKGIQGVLPKIGQKLGIYTTLKPKPKQQRMALDTSAGLLSSGEPSEFHTEQSRCPASYRDIFLNPYSIIQQGFPLTGQFLLQLFYYLPSNLLNKGEVASHFVQIS